MNFNVCEIKKKKLGGWWFPGWYAQCDKTI